MMLIKDPPVEITGDFWMLGTNEFPIYLFRGSGETTIFEGGIGSLGPVLRRQFQELDVAQESVRQLVLTHAHPDHVMAVPMIRKLCPQVQVLASSVAAKTLAVEKAVSFFCRLDDTLTAALVDTGRIGKDDCREPLAENRIAVDRVLSDGDTVAVDDGVAFQVIETPGHSDCSLSFHQPDRGILIVSDATGYYMPQHNGWWPNYFSSYGTYVDSIERLADLNAEVLCLSHNGTIRGAGDVATYFQGVLESTRAYHVRIVEESKAGKSVREIAGVLGSEVHEKTPLMPVDFFQKNCALLVKNSLRQEGLEPDG